MKVGRLIAEKTFMQMVIDAARLCSWECYHTYDSRRSTPGFPDIVASHPDRGTFFAELKTHRGKLRPDQERWIETLQSSGSTVFVWRPDDWDEIVRVLNEGVKS